MEKLHNRPLMRRVKAQSSGPRRIWNSAKVLIKGAAPRTLFALCGAVAIGLAAFHAFTPKTVGLKDSARTQTLPTPMASPAVPADKDSGVVTPPLDVSQAQHGTVAADHSTTDRTPAAAPTPAPVLKNEPKAFASDGEFLEKKWPEAEPKNPDKQLPEAVRKNLEKGRREAERKRSRLEDQFQRHLISSEAYKKGEEEYKREIEKYRSEVSVGGEAKNESSRPF